MDDRQADLGLTSTDALEDAHAEHVAKARARLMVNDERDREENRQRVKDKHLKRRMKDRDLGKSQSSHVYCK